jgi:isocitrate dehydrogenase kinase/phosphatase
VLSSLFFRNKGAYVIGKVVNGYRELPFSLPILHNEAGDALVIDTALIGEDDLQMLFSFARAYFMVDMEIPSAYVQFLRSMMPRKPRWELYNALGLHKQGKNIFYRDFLYHLRHSSDHFRIAPGIKGMVMLVFDLPSFPFVFKLIKDYYPPQKDTTREQIKGKYLLVKQHDRVGRMADTLEFSGRRLPAGALRGRAGRGDPPLRAQPAGDLRPRRRRPHRADPQARLHRAPHGAAQPLPAGGHAHAAGGGGGRVRQRHQGPGGRQHLPRRHAVEELRRDPPGQGRVLRLRRDRVHHRLQLPPRAAPAHRGRRDVRRDLVLGGPQGCLPGDLRPFLLGNQAVREVFMAHHADLLDAAFWQSHQARIKAGDVQDVFPYDPGRRFAVRRRLAAIGGH